MASANEKVAKGQKEKKEKPSKKSDKDEVVKEEGAKDKDNKVS